MIFLRQPTNILQHIKRYLMNKRQIRDFIRLVFSLLFCWLYIPHVALYGCMGEAKSDVQRIKKQISLNLRDGLAFLFLIHQNRYFRSLFYYRIGPVWAMLIGWWRPGDRYFQISYTTKIGKGVLIAHPYSTVINAESIGDNFSCIHCTTLGETSKGRPIVGNNVSLGANVTIIGPVHIGNNVIIGAGSVVVKDIPDNSVAVGNPARVIKIINSH